MLEFNIDKDAGIQLHTCQRKSRWCKSLLWLSWLAMLAFLGWLFWKGLLANAFALGSSPNTTPAKPVAPVSQTLATDCEANNKAQSAACQKQLSALESELNHQFSRKYSQQLKQSGQKLKDTRKALQQAQDKIKSLEQKQADKSSSVDPGLKEKLFFYEKIMGSNGVKDAVFINHFAVRSLDKERHYRFQLILARLGKHVDTTGDFDIFLKGNKRVESKQTETLADGKTREKILVKKQPVTYKHTDLLPKDSVSSLNTFAFKYYQIIEGGFVLPEKFELQSLSLSVNPEGLSSLRNNYEWKNIKQQAFKVYKKGE